MSTFNDMVRFVKSAWPARKFVVPCLVGPVGIGKTAAVNKAAKELGVGKVVTIIASQILPNEVSGITMPVPETKSMEIFDHYRLSSLEDGDILFFDELLEADELVLSACLTLIESRFMMSGNKLPDVMIVAATNPTVQPTMLKENIRQRFGWKRFELDRHECREYIEEFCGLDIGFELARAITCEGDEYNILSPRMMTKMAHWTTLAENAEQAADIEWSINGMWNSTLGTKLRQRWDEHNLDPMIQTTNAIKSVVAKLDISPFGMEDGHSHAVEALFSSETTFDNDTLSEVMEVLQKLPEWDSIVEELGKIQLEKADEEQKVSF